MTMTNIERGWRPEPRPAWVQRINRAGLGLADPAAVVPLDEASLIEAAQSATGFEDFGPDEWREPFRLLLSDIAEHACLNTVGRILARYDIIRSLTVRLQMAAIEKEYPDILRQPIEEPVIITGMGRTGTSILYELMAQDPRWRVPLGWELRYPSPPPEANSRGSDPRISLAQSDIDLWYEVIPELIGMHETSSMGPEEDVVALSHEFIAASLTAFHKAPNLDAYIAIHGDKHAYRFHRRIFQHLQFRTPGRWLWKGPAHLSRLPSLLGEYPDARIIMTHRDPVTVLASTANLISTLRWQRSDVVNHQEFAQTLGFGLPFLFDMVVKQRSSGVLPENKFTDVRFADLMADHVATVRDVYSGLGLQLDDEVADRMRAYIEQRPRGRHGGAGYRFEDCGVDESEFRARIAPYMEKFDVPKENNA